MSKKTCFVVMGFGTKTDYQTGRVLDLDKSYRNIIKPAAEAADLDCTRADEIIHSGVIDKPMFEQLLTADVVVADVSTYNCNAFYELGVRHALRPRTTITIAEDKMVFPFDINHIAIRKYQHLGTGIDFEEVNRMRDELQRAMETIASQDTDDSPVYLFLRGLNPPLRGTLEAVPPAATRTEAPAATDTRTVGVLMEQMEAAKAQSDWSTAKSLLSVVRTLLPRDSYVLQQLALATYKNKLSDPRKALEEARDLLNGLQPDVTTDIETLGLWGAVHKRLWDLSGNPGDLDQAVFAHEKGFYLKNDYYNGINLAFLLNLRASKSEPAEAIADFILARRVRKRVITLCEKLLESTHAPPDDVYWTMATVAEAWLGLEDAARSTEWLNRAFQLKPEPAGWMKESTKEQVGRLEQLIKDSPLRHIVK